MIGIYKITNLINDKCYIGQTNNIKKRHREHFTSLRLNNHFNIHLQRAWNKYGEENFEFSILEEVSDLSLLNELEIKYIKEYNALSLGYNQTSGGSPGILLPAEKHRDYDHTLYTFYHISGIVEENITRYNFMKKHNILSSSITRLMSGDNLSTNGWAIKKENLPTESKIFLWINKSGEQIECSAREMYRRYNNCTNFFHIIRAEPLKQSCKGWRYVKQILN